jgi:hypothetical protein
MVAERSTAEARAEDVLLFGLFAATLLGIAAYHKLALRIALTGLGCVVLTRLTLTDFALGSHLAHEWRTIVNLGGLLLGFSVLANYFEKSHLPEKLTEVLPGGRLGAFLLLVLVALLSAVLDNIAAALIGGAAAITLFQRKLHVGYLAAIVEASLGAVVAIAFFGLIAARQQTALQPLVRGKGEKKHVDVPNVLVVGLIIVGAISTNILLEFPAVGVWGAILIACVWRRPDWNVLPGAAVGSAFLLSLVLCASMMPVESLPEASAVTALGLGVVSAFFDNIPLTALAIRQGGYDWGFLAYAVGYGGSMLWFGSSAGVAISGLFPEAKSVKHWVTSGWHVAVGYFLGFFAMWLVIGWHPSPPKSAAGAGEAAPPAHAASEAGTPHSSGGGSGAGPSAPGR